MKGLDMLSQDISFEEKDNNKYAYIYYVINSPFLSPTDITKEIGIAPSHAFAKGERYLGKGVDEKTGKKIDVWRERPTGIWRIDSKQIESQEKRVEEHFQYLLRLLEPKEIIILKYLQQLDKEYRIFFDINWKPFDDWGSYEIKSDTLRRASRLCHHIEFSLTEIP